jgi:hypothetical protein
MPTAVATPLNMNRRGDGAGGDIRVERAELFTSCSENILPL